MTLRLSDSEIPRSVAAAIGEWETSSITDMINNLLIKLDEIIAHDVIQTGHLDIISDVVTLHNDISEWGTSPPKNKEHTAGEYLARILDISAAANERIQLRQEHFKVRYETYLDTLISLRDKLMTKEDCLMSDMIQVYTVNAEIDRITKIVKDFDPESVTAKDVHVIWLLTTRTLLLL